MNLRSLLVPLFLSACLELREAAADLRAEVVEGTPFAQDPPVPGLALLREGQEARIRTALGLSSLASLPAYTLDLSISDIEGRYEGQGSLRFTNTTGRPQATLPLLLHPNAPGQGGAPDSGTLTLHALTCVEGPACTWSQESATVVRVALARPLAPGEAVVIETRFGGRLRRLSAASNDVFAQSMGGMGQLGAPVGAADYGLLGAGDDLLTAASAYPMLAPFVDGEPVVQAPGAVGDLAWNQLATFDLRVVTPDGLRVVTNLVDSPPEPLGEGVGLTRASGAAVRDLVLVASRAWQVEERVVDGVTLRSWFLAQDAAAGRAVLDDAEAALRTLGDLLGPYPYTELDVAEATLVGGAGGVEFSGMVLIAGFLYRDPGGSQSPMAQLMQLWGSLGMGGMGAQVGEMLADQRTFVVSHELAHQWVPGLVGTDSQSEPILDEALAQYLAGRVAQAGLGAEAGAEVRDRNVLLNYALYRLLGGADAVAWRPTRAFASTLEYGALVYGKAPYLYVALEERHGQAAVDRALRQAVDSLAWGIADQQDWLAALEAGGLGQARGAAERWWQQAHGDEDLGVDDDGAVAVRLMFGEQMAAQMDRSLAITGMSFGSLLRMMMGGTPAAVPYQPGTPSPEDMLRLLEGR